MAISSIEVSTFPVPFRRPFSHASATRTRARNIIVGVSSGDGVTGYGEGCPREYVTGETVGSAREFLAGHAVDAARSATSVENLRRWIALHEGEIDRNPAAFCALELALLDHMARAGGVSIEALLKLPEMECGHHRYTAVIGGGGVLTAGMLAVRYCLTGLVDFKVKLTGDPALDSRRILFSRFVPFRRLRFDANNLWRNPKECIDHLTSLGASAGFAIEEPLQAGDIAGFREVAVARNMAIILDESFLSPEMLDQLPGDVEWIINVRISKLGGLLRTLDAVEAVRGSGHGIIVGAHVGETGILARAALPVADAAGDALVAQEGAFGNYLLEQDLTKPSPRFGFRGSIPKSRLPRPGGAGMGLVVDVSMLEQREVLL